MVEILELLEKLGFDDPDYIGAFILLSVVLNFFLNKKF